MIHESGGPGNNTEDDKSLDKNTKKGCVGSAILLTWFFPPLWPLAIAATWGMYPKTSKKVAIGLGIALAVAIAASFINGANDTKPLPESSRDESINPPGDERAKTTADESIKPAEDERTRTEAEFNCRKAIKETLNDPGSMRIGWGDVISGSNSDDGSEWVVKFPFSARNSFNAVIKSYGQCRVSKSTGLVLWSEVQ